MDLSFPGIFPDTKPVRRIRVTPRDDQSLEHMKQNCELLVVGDKCKLKEY